MNPGGGPVRVTFLGTGDAFSANGSHQAGYLIQGADTSVLLDAGAGLLAAMRRLDLDPGVVDLVLISHLHGDHFCGVPFLLLDYLYNTRRHRPLRIAGPPGTARRVLDVFRNLYGSWEEKQPAFSLQFTELQPEHAVDLAGVGVDSFAVPHQDAELSLGLCVTLAGRRILYSGDTGWTERLVERSHDTDLFICECSFFDTRLPMHLDYPRIAEHRARFGTRRLILTHLGREVHARRADIDAELAYDGLRVEL